MSTITLPSFFSSGMVLQAQRPIPLWGYAEKPAASVAPVSAEFLGKTYTAYVEASGAWRLILDGAEPGGPYVLGLDYDGTSLTIEDVYIGDVFLCAGQSNMELPMERLKDDYPEEWQKESYPLIRELRFPYTVHFSQPQDNPAPASWKQVSAETLGGFSGTAYFFAQQWSAERRVPVGIILAAVGGAPIEAFMPKETLASVHSQGQELASWADKLADGAYAARLVAEHEEATGAWDAALSLAQDPLAKDAAFLSGHFEAEGTLHLPGPFAQDPAFRDFQGVVYFRRSFTVRPEDALREARLWLGTIVDSDTAFINGVQVGETAYRYPPRKYRVPQGVLQPGENTLVLRVVCCNGLGELTPDKPLSVFFGTPRGSGRSDLPEDRIELSGSWSYRITRRTEARRANFFIHWQPSGLYNGLIAPALRLPLRAALWYQGESNADTLESAQEYRALLRAMIGAWRERAEDLFPVIIASLPVFGAPEDPLRRYWGELRKSQAAVVAELPAVVLADCYDLGEWNDLHPVNKRGVGERLFAAIRQRV
ncbi:MAG: sialate O-acetylesterase [Spirochaetaceae bacterium]|jgi:sialate O-acetylesterase|nr:sialate O-acetylesterase [Spirochaetaceae bacterium]